MPSTATFPGRYVAFCLFAYFFFHLLHGDRGYFGFQALEAEIADTNARYETLRVEREALQNKVSLMRPQSIDADLLEERARIVLGYGLPQEWIVLK